MVCLGVTYLQRLCPRRVLEGVGNGLLRVRDWEGALCAPFFAAPHGAMTSLFIRHHEHRFLDFLEVERLVKDHGHRGIRRTLPGSGCCVLCLQKLQRGPCQKVEFIFHMVHIPTRD